MIAFAIALAIPPSGAPQDRGTDARAIFEAQDEASRLLDEAARQVEAAGEAAANAPDASAMSPRYIFLGLLSTRSVRQVAYVDTAEVRRRGSLIRAWELGFYDGQPTGLAIGTRQVRSLMEHDCSERSYRILQLVTYASNGEAISHIRPAAPEPAYSVPDTLAGAATRFVCEGIAPPGSTWVSDPTLHAATVFRLPRN